MRQTVNLPLMNMAAAATRQVIDTLEGVETARWQHFACDVVMRDSMELAQKS
jgi:hypothetical protein